MSTYLRQVLAIALATFLWAIGLSPALAADSVGVNMQYKICNLPDGATLPNADGKFICAVGDYSGNAGKNWNELDLVPLRLTLSAGNSAPALQTYTHAVVVDFKDGGKPGYDVLSVLTLNPALSSAGCQAAVSGDPLPLVPGSGGTDEQLYRLVTFTQPKNTTCTYDFYARLALGASTYPGASLHANVLNENLSSAGGDRDRSIPVDSITAQSMTKTMAATQNATHAWNLTKTATPSPLDFGDVCKAPIGPLEKPVQVTVTWTKMAASPSGEVTVVTNINVNNPAARTISIQVKDTVYKDQTASTQLAQQTSQLKPVAARFNGLFHTFTYTLPASAAGNVGDYLNDVAEATYVDTVTGVSIPLTVTATAKAQIQTGTTENETANISDLEAITGTGLAFKVAAPSVGAFTGGYVAGTSATSVGWGVTGLAASGSVTFNKTVVLDQRRITSGELTDTATLVSTDSQFTTEATLIPVKISSSATVKLTVNKTIPLALKAGESVVVNFTVTGGSLSSAPLAVTFTGPSAIGASASNMLEGLDPASYTVTEINSVFYDAARPLGVALNLVPDGSNQQTVNLSPKAGGVMDDSNCSGAVSFVNIVPSTDLPRVQVKKITDPVLLAADPDYVWTFTLTGPTGFTPKIVTANAGQGFALFDAQLSQEGTYTVTETVRTGWDLTSVNNPNGSTSTTVCTFVIDFPNSLGTTPSCTFTNTKRGKVKVVKLLSGNSVFTEQFTFQLRTGASSTAEGSALESMTTNSGGNGSTLNFASMLVPGTTYQMCESIQAGWMTSFNDPSSQLFVPGAFQPPTGSIPNPNVDNGWLCVNFTVAAGAIKTFTIDNSPPPGGRALTIGYWKNHASCSSSGARKTPALDAALNSSSGILKSSRIISMVPGIPVGVFGLYGQTATATADCRNAVYLLDKRNFTGAKKASDPLFNMAAQLVAVELNLAAGAYTCGKVQTWVGTAEGLLAKYSFTGFGYTGTLSTGDASTANKTASMLDDYNNNRAGVCP